MTLLILVEISKFQLFSRGLPKPFPWLYVERTALRESRRDGEKGSLFSEEFSLRSLQRVWDFMVACFFHSSCVAVTDPEPKHRISIWSRH